MYKDILHFFNRFKPIEEIVVKVKCGGEKEENYNKLLVVQKGRRPLLYVIIILITRYL